MVVGDERPLFRGGVVRALSSSGEIDVVAEASDGASAVELTKTHQPDAALLDYRMPGLDGTQVAAAPEAVTRPPLSIATTTQRAGIRNPPESSRGPPARLDRARRTGRLRASRRIS